MKTGAKNRSRATQSAWGLLGQNIRRLRKARRWTQAQLGQRLERRKLSRQAIAWIESGKNTDLETIADISLTLGVSIEALSTDTSGATGFENGARQLTDVNDPVRLVDRLLSLPPGSWEQELSANVRFHSLAVVRELIARAQNTFYVDPVRCLAISSAAAHLAELTQVASAEVRFDALKDLAHARWRVGQYSEALQCLDQADAVANECANPAHRKGIAQFVRSIVYTMSERFVEARRDLFEARAALREIDPWRHLLTFHHEAVIRALTDDPLGAAKIVDSLVEELQCSNDDRELAQLYTQGAHAWYRAGDLSRARGYMARAREIQLRLGLNAEIAINDAGMAEILADEGQREKAILLLARARRKFVKLGLKREIIVLDLSVLRIKASMDADPHDIHDLAARIASDALSAGFPAMACEAIDSLRQSSKTLSIEDIDHVRAVVRRSFPAALLKPIDIN